MPNDQDVKYAIEALLFASERPLSPEQIREAFSAEGGSASGGEASVRASRIKASLDELKSEYETQNRGFRLCEIAGGWQLATDDRFAPYLKRFFQNREKRRLSQASLETLSVVAYRQPVTRADIEFIRGVNVDGALKTLLEKGLVRITGRKEVPGRPMLYGTTKEFLEHFGLASVKELPALSEFTLKDIDENLLPPELKTDERK
ncbi:MAG: SMC-Scp complex subunit ScpB [Omnitrophica bacterium RIFCSPHIGHO2_02_FULL_63_14]|nr:MAG: SMC-Scp complex subunit ScpB [Omnitrophica bacterium RIFCSPHIGHO2_02_FULL_63_14]